MRTIELYRKHKAGEVSRDKFIYEVRRDKNLPWVTNLTSFDDAVKILKNKGIISELQDNSKLDQKLDTHRKDYDKKAAKDYLASLEGMYNASPTDYIEKMIEKQKADMIKNFGPNVFSKEEEALNEVDNNVPTDPAVDRVNPYFLKKGVQMLLDKEKELTNDSYIKALNKAALMLQKNPHVFDEEMFANAKDVAKADAKLGTEEVKKNNLVNKDRQMKKMKGQNIDKANTKVSTKENKKGKPKGVQMMKEDALKDLYNSLKKKDLINEDSHWKHHVGSEVHTADGKGKVIEIVGGTLTVEMEDGSQKDYQINTIDHHTQKAQENQADTEKIERDAAWKKFDSLKGAAPETGDQMGPSIGQELNYKPEDIQTLLRKYIDKNKDDKEKMGKLKEAVKKLKEKISDKEMTTARSTGQVVNVPSNNKQDIQTLEKNKVVYSTYPE
jgi:hypothetical protein